jgi:integrase
MIKKEKFKRRGNNEGTICQRKDGRWCGAVSVEISPLTGIKTRKYVYGKTRQEVADEIISIQNKVNKGIYKNPSKITLGQWLDTWLFEYKKINLRLKTFESYEGLIRTHLKPSLGTIQLKNIRPEQIQAMLNEKYLNGRIDGTGGLSSRTVKYLSVILSESLEQAIKNGLISTNPCNAIVLPKQIKKEIKVLTIEEQIKFLNTARNHRLGCSFVLALATGLRLGELLALKWSDIDFKNGTLHVKRSVSRVKEFESKTISKNKLVIQEPKTKSSKRVIPIPRNVLRELKEYKLTQNAEKLKLGSAYQDTDIIFSTEFGTIVNPRNFERTFYNTLKAAGLEHINFHALRHTYATRLLEANIHPKVAQELLGHSSISMTLDTYSSVLPDVKIAAAEKINDLFQKEKNNKDNKDQR